MMVGYGVPVSARVKRVPVRCYASLLEIICSVSTVTYRQYIRFIVIRHAMHHTGPLPVEG